MIQTVIRPRLFYLLIIPLGRSGVKQLPFIASQGDQQNNVWRCCAEWAGCLATVLRSQLRFNTHPLNYLGSGNTVNASWFI